MAKYMTVRQMMDMHDYLVKMTSIPGKVTFIEEDERLIVARKCDDTLNHTLKWMTKHKIENISGNIRLIRGLGGNCDCNVINNQIVKQWMFPTNRRRRLALCH